MSASTRASSTLGDVGAWAFNVSSSVAIVFCNKALMDPKWGYKFVFGEMRHGHMAAWPRACEDILIGILDFLSVHQ